MINSAMIRGEEIERFFSENGNEIVTNGKVRIRKAKEEFYINFSLEGKDEERFTRYELYDEVIGVEEFIIAYQLENVHDLKLITVSRIWLRYLAEKAEVIMTNGDDNSVHFRPFRGITMVYSRDLNYYTEVYRVLNMTEHFKEFVIDNWDLIEEMSCKK